MIGLALLVCHLIQNCVCVTFIILFSFALPRIIEISPEKVYICYMKEHPIYQLKDFICLIILQMFVLTFAKFSIFSLVKCLESNFRWPQDKSFVLAESFLWYLQIREDHVAAITWEVTEILWRWLLLWISTSPIDSSPKNEKWGMCFAAMFEIPDVKIPSIWEPGLPC